MNNSDKIAKQIIGKLGAIGRNEITPKESGIGKLFKALKDLDEPMYIELLNKYKTIQENGNK